MTEQKTYIFNLEKDCQLLLFQEGSSLTGTLFRSHYPFSIEIFESDGDYQARLNAHRVPLPALKPYQGVLMNLVERFFQ